MEAMRPLKSDRRILRSQRALREALVAELSSGVDIARVSVAALTERAGLTRRTFYSHYKDIPDFIEQVETGLFDEIRVRVRAIAEATNRRPARSSCLRTSPRTATSSAPS